MTSLRKALRGALAAALLAAIVAIPAAAALAAMTADQVAKKIANDYGVQVLGVETATGADGQTVFAVKVMNKGGNWNHAFQVNTIAVDPATGEPVVQYGQTGGQLRRAAPPVQDRTAPMTAADR